jgi:hypothetical protein
VHHGLVDVQTAGRVLDKASNRTIACGGRLSHRAAKNTNQGFMGRKHAELRGGIKLAAKTPS